MGDKMKLLEQKDCIFLMVDIQERLLNSVFNKDILAKKAEIVAEASTILDIPTIVTEQYPKGLGATVSNVKDKLSNETKYFEKTTFNALQDESLLAELKSLNRKQVLVAGIETHICVYQTVLALINAGFEVTLIKDCCGSRSEEEYLQALDVIKTLGANIKTTEMILFELLKGAKHPNFKEIQALIK